jgi:hypothetical protein
MPGSDRLRRLELLSYLTALVYHDRAPSEREEMVDLVQSSARTDDFRLEVDMARRTIADEIREEGEHRGAIRAQQRTLLRLLRQRFGNLPSNVEQAVQATQDAERLERWLDRVVPSNSLADVGIGEEV